MNDATRVAAFLRESCKFDEVLLLTDETERKPTRDNILEAMRWLTSSASDGDTLVFHYSGHGALSTEPGQSGQHECTLPIDTEKRLYDDDYYSSLVVPVLHRQLYLMAIFDCCHSGSELELGWRFNFDPRSQGPVCSQVAIRPGSGLHVALASQVAKAKIIYLGACSDEQSAADTVNSDGLACGALSEAFLSVMTSSKRVNWHTLIAEVTRRVHGQDIQCYTLRPLDLSMEPVL